MLRRVGHCKRVTAAAATVHQWQKLHGNPPIKSLLYQLSAPCSSSSSRKSSSFLNYYLRKNRKWPSYISHNHQTFAFQLAMRSFKQSIKISRTHLLSSLIDSFATYEINPTPQAYHFLFKILIQKHAFDDQISQILDHIEKAESFETPECIFIDLIKFYGNNNMFTEAVELFYRIPKFRCDPSVEALNALLLVLSRNENGLTIIPEILMKSREMKIGIAQSSFEILIRALCRIGNIGNAFQLLCHMVDEGFSVDEKICSLMLATKCRQQHSSGGEIMGFLEDLKCLGFEPRKDDLCNVIRHLVKRGKGTDALKILKQMKMVGSAPDIMSYNLVLEGLIFEKEFSRADKVFDELLVLGLIPNISTYNVYIRGLCMQKKVEDAMHMLVSMGNLGCAPNSSTYSPIIRALCEAGKLDRARELVNEMRKTNLQLNSETCEFMVDDFVNHGE